MPAAFYTSRNGKPVKHDSPESAATEAWAALGKSAARSLLVYIHGRDMKAFKFGRDGEPKSSFKEGIVEELAANDCIVVMLHWPHSVPMLDPTHVPINDAKAAAPALGALVTAIARSRPAAEARTVNLVTHSTGSVVLEEACRTIAFLPDDLTNIIVASAASPIDGATKWLQPLRNRCYVTTNLHDPMLEKASNGGPFLGMQSAASFPNAEITEGIIYLDLTPTKLGHRYFVAAGSGSDASDLARVRKCFFAPLYRGETLDPTGFAPSQESPAIMSLR